MECAHSCRRHAARYVPRASDSRRAATQEVAMPVEPVSTPSAPPVAGAYSPAVRAGDWLVLAGQIGLDPRSGAIVEGDELQARQAPANNRAILPDCRASVTHRAQTPLRVR